MLEIESALESDPEYDILSVIPASYTSRMARRSAPPSAIARLNRGTIDTLKSLANQSPKIDLLSHFLRDYRIHCDRGMNDPNHSRFKIHRPPRRPDPPLDETLTRLASATTVEVIFPLSDEVNDLISRHDCGTENESLPFSETLAVSLKKLFSASYKVWEYLIHGAVFKCNNAIMAKVIAGFRTSIGYPSMQYLQKHAPEIPPPRPHGLIKLGNFWAIFMTYIPLITLEEAWPSLFHEQKISIQHEMNDVLLRLRELKQPDGLPLGGIGEEGVDDHY